MNQQIGLFGKVKVEMHKFSWAIFRNKQTSHEENIALIRASNLFDAKWYLENNPEVGFSKIDPISHYLKIGAISGRDPSPQFNSLDYIRANPDVGAALVNPLLHYVKHGMTEGRRLGIETTTLDESEISKEVDPYLPSSETESDLALSDNDDDIDIQEVAPAHSPFTELSTTVQLLRKTLKSRLSHLQSIERDVSYTNAQKVTMSGLFDREYYLASNPEVAASGEDPAEHFARIGYLAGLKPNPDFEPDFYLARNKDVAALGLNPLIHFAEFGIIEGRLPSAQAMADMGIVEHTNYDDWVAKYDTVTTADQAAMERQILRFNHRASFSIVMPVYNTPADLLTQAIESVIAQVYPDWELCIANDASTAEHVKPLLDAFQARDPRIKVVHREHNGHISASSNSAIALATGTFLALMDHDDLIPSNALFEFASRLNDDPDLDVLYSDEDGIDRNGRRFDPYFKTVYNRELMLSHNMVNHFGVYRRSLVERVGGFRVGFEGSQDYDLTLRVVDETDASRIAHIPSILYHWRRGGDESSYSEQFMDRCVKAARTAIREHLERRGEPGTVMANPAVSSWHRVVRSFKGQPPLVSVIIPTKDKADILRVSCEGVLRKTDYPNLELLVVDHQSREPETFALFEELKADDRVRIIGYTGPFNYSAINNHAVTFAKGELLCLLNNDVEVIGSDWLRELAAQAVLPDVGAVGAKLLYPDDRMQHGGVILGVGGVAGHRFHLLGRDDLGHNGRAALPADISAVTGACLVVKRSIFNEVGGLDADNLAVAFNDIDLCIKIAQAGYRNIYNPYALLYHHESLSRGDDLTGEKQQRFMREVDFMVAKWGSTLLNDPFYNPNQNLSSADYTLSWPPRIQKSWLGKARRRER